MLVDLLIRHAHLLTPTGSSPLAGEAQRDLISIKNATIAAADGHVVYAGPEPDGGIAVAREGHTIDAAGATVVPGFVDAHTHAAFAGDRRSELQRRLAGATYAEIAAEGGGILATVGATRSASERELAAQTRARLDEMLACGTTTAEVKSGYGLETAAELKMLRCIRGLDAAHPIDLVPTFLGAHEVAPEYRGRREEYVRVVVEEMIPAVAAAGLARWCDVFCETGVFTPEDSRAILRAGQAVGLQARIHADELAASGGSQVAADVGARSADHLIHVPADGIAAMAQAGVIATLLPCAAFYLKLGRFAPARALVAAGVPVALATDVNPGGGFSPSMPFAMALACFGMQMTFEEALAAATLNAACSLDRGDRAGSVEVGKPMDVVIVEGGAVNLIRVGAPAIRAVVKAGKVLHAHR
ncbi:MAG TPA: imidazolonepropionase [Vicinamibacterales bacterium]|nr:imidazolonepropionase [Vicinamibacterales bacterium]